MALAYAQMQPRFFGGPELTKRSALVSEHTSAEPSNDSDDDYDYVATLAEQIVHAMLDDDDSREDESFGEPVVFGGCPQFRKIVSNKADVQGTVHDSWSNYTLDPKIGQEQSRLQSLSSSMSVPFYCHRSSFFNGSGEQATAECSNGSGLTPAFSPGEAGALCAALEVSERSSGERGLAHVSKQSNVVALPRSSTTLTANESFRLPAIAASMVEGTERLVNATKLPCQQAGSDGVYHMRLNHGSLQWQDRSWACSNERSRNNAGRRRRINRDAKGVRASFCLYSVQASSPLQYVPPELPDTAGVQAFVTQYGSGRTGTTGTGVFLPRANSTSSSHRRKSEGGLAVKRGAQTPKSFVEDPKVNISRHGRKYSIVSELTQ